MKKLNILVIAALVLCLGTVAQAQNRFVVVEMVTQPAPAARAGGESEASGSIWLSFSDAGAGAATTVTVNYSVPLAMNIALAPDMLQGVTQARALKL